MPTSEKLTAAQVSQNKYDNIMQTIAERASFYRANPHRFASEYLNVQLDKDQQINLCMMFQKAFTVYIASRGAGKSFLLALFSVEYCILYPGTTVCVASKTRIQATGVIEKIKDILMPLSSNLRMEISDIQIGQNKAEVVFKNSSLIKVVTANDNARYNRATVLICDESRMLDKDFIDTVLRNFLTSQREPLFYRKPEYKDYPKEKNKELYATSAWFENHWSYEQVRSYVVNMVYGRDYFACALPYQLAIEEGRLDPERIEDEMSESTFSDTNFQMEMQALFLGDAVGGLYTFDEIDKNRTLTFPVYPKWETVLPNKKFQLGTHQAGEIRILSADIALMPSTKNNNDATAIFLNQMLPLADGKYVSNILYTTNCEGLRTDAQALIIRKLFAEFACDYLVIDARGIGMGVVDALLGDIYDPDEAVTYEALSCENDDILASRCTNPKARKAIWAIHGSPELNSQCALELREAFRRRSVRLLVNEYDCDSYLNEIKGYGALNAQQLTYLKMPYIHTSLAVNELINLQHEQKNGVVRVKEKPGMRKDRYSSLSYNIFVAKELEKRENEKRKRPSGNNLLLAVRPPKTKK